VLTPSGNPITTTTPIGGSFPGRYYVISLLRDQLGGSLQLSGTAGATTFPLPAPHWDAPPTVTPGSPSVSYPTTTAALEPPTTSPPEPPTTGPA
jgi:hypothetical protein